MGRAWADMRNAGRVPLPAAAKPCQAREVRHGGMLRQLMKPGPPLQRPAGAATCHSPCLDPLGLAGISALQHTLDAAPQFHDACSSTQPRGRSSGTVRTLVAAAPTSKGGAAAA